MSAVPINLICYYSQHLDDRPRLLNLRLVFSWTRLRRVLRAHAPGSQRTQPSRRPEPPLNALPLQPRMRSVPLGSDTPPSHTPRGAPESRSHRLTATGVGPRPWGCWDSPGMGSGRGSFPGDPGVPRLPSRLSAPSRMQRCVFRHGTPPLERQSHQRRKGKQRLRKSEARNNKEIT